jgi:hypothetical protein
MPPATAAIQINLIWMAPLMVVKQSQAAHIGGYVSGWLLPRHVAVRDRQSPEAGPGTG